MVFRISTFVAIAFIVLFAPWWLTAILILIPLFYFKWYLEAIFLGVIYDILFSVPVSYLYGIEMIATIYTTLSFIVFYFLKKNLFWTQEW